MRSTTHGCRGRQKHFSPCANWKAKSPSVILIIGETSEIQDCETKGTKFLFYLFCRFSSHGS